MELPMNVRCDSCGEFMYQVLLGNVGWSNSIGTLLARVTCVVHEVLFLTPLRSHTCQGKRFNARKEDVQGEDYLGLR